jgi:peptidoglycan/LPS O-acetylase OafA/YrhL
MNREKALSVLWGLELIIGLGPAVMTLFAGFVSYFALLTRLPQLLHQANPMMLKSFFYITVMIIGGILGFISIIMAANPEQLRLRKRRRAITIAFGCAGIAASITFFLVDAQGFSSHNPLVYWVAFGPLLVGIHCAWRVFHDQSSGGYRSKTLDSA